MLTCVFIAFHLRRQTLLASSPLPLRPSLSLSSAAPLPLINDYKLISISLGFTLPPDSGEKLSLGTCTHIYINQWPFRFIRIDKCINQVKLLPLFGWSFLLSFFLACMLLLFCFCYFCFCSCRCFCPLYTLPNGCIIYSDSSNGWKQKQVIWTLIIL